MKERREISVLETGAVPGGESIQTAAFQRALDEVFLAGGGTVVVPAGSYRIGGVRLRSGCTLYLESGATLIGVRDPEAYGVLENDALQPISASDRTDRVWERAKLGVPRDYSFLRAGSRWNHGVIRALDAENIAVIGEAGAVIDGSDCFDEIGEEHYRGPHGINFHRCRNVTLRGYTAQNTGNWAHALWYCENVTCEGVTVLGGHDGIHFTRCVNTRIRNCSFYTGDDCVAGFGNLNTVVTDCVCNTACSAFRFGGTNLLAERCRCFGPAKYLFRGSLSPEEKRASARTSETGRRNMLALLTYYADHSVEIPYQPGNLIFRNCTVENAARFLHYNFSGNEVWQMGSPLQSVRFEEVTAENVTVPLTAYGDPSVPLSLELRNVRVSFGAGMENSPCLRAAHFDRVALENVTFRGRTNGELMRLWSEPGELICKGLVTETPIRETIVNAAEPFSCKSI